AARARVNVFGWTRRFPSAPISAKLRRTDTDTTGDHMRVTAAVLYDVNKPYSVETVELDPPKRGEVLIRVGAAGVCRSDLHFQKGEATIALPAVLGHEGAGTVQAVGEGVTMAKPGDRVILSFVPNCGHCHSCESGRPHLCDEHARTTGKLYDNTSRLHTDAGQAGAHTIVAVDVKDPALAFAKKFGATHTVNARTENAVARVQALTGGGVHFAFEAYGSGATTRMAVDMLRKRGTAVIVGIAPAGDTAAIEPVVLTRGEKTITGTYYGSAHPRQDMPRIADWVERGLVD